MSEPAWVRNHKGRVFTVCTRYGDEVHIRLLGGGPYLAWPQTQFVTVWSDTTARDHFEAGITVSLKAYRTTLVPMDWLRRTAELEIPTAECPNCGNDDMIFYSEDYICAWCREILEEECQ